MTAVTAAGPVPAVGQERHRATARGSRHHSYGFWIAAIAFMTNMAFSTVPTPLYALYQRRDRLTLRAGVCFLLPGLLLLVGGMWLPSLTTFVIGGVVTGAGRGLVFRGAYIGLSVPVVAVAIVGAVRSVLIATATATTSSAANAS